MFPIISLKWPNKFLKFSVPIITQLVINDYVFLRDDSINKTHEALVTLSLFTCLVIMHEITPYFGLEDKRKKAKRSMEGQDTQNTDDTHILYHMLFASLTYFAWISIVIDLMKTEYAPFHCKHQKDLALDKCEFKSVDPVGLIFTDLGYLVLMIFGIGPLRLFLKIKEGKTSLKKMEEDYIEDRQHDFIRTALRNRQAQSEDRGYLPTSNAQARRAARNTSIEEFS